MTPVIGRMFIEDVAHQTQKKESSGDIFLKSRLMILIFFETTNVRGIFPPRNYSTTTLCVLREPSAMYIAIKYLPFAIADKSNVL